METGEPAAQTDAIAAVVVDSALEVYRHLGPAFLERIYEHALCQELTMRGVGYARQVAMPIMYKGRMVGKGQADLVVARRVVVELKALPALLPLHVAQTISYLKAAQLQLGLLLNFGQPHFRCRRVVLTPHEPR